MADPALSTQSQFVPGEQIADRLMAHGSGGCVAVRIMSALIAFSKKGGAGKHFKYVSYQEYERPYGSEIGVTIDVCGEKRTAFLNRDCSVVGLEGRTLFIQDGSPKSGLLETNLERDLIIVRGNLSARRIRELAKHIFFCVFVQGKVWVSAASENPFSYDDGKDRVPPAAKGIAKSDDRKDRVPLGVRGIAGNDDPHFFDDCVGGHAIGPRFGIIPRR